MPSHRATITADPPRSSAYAAVQHRLARGWNTWDVHSVATQVLLPEALAIHIGLKHNTSENSDAFLGDALIGRLAPGSEVVTPGPHAWDGSYTSASYEWHGHRWTIESAHDGPDLVLLVTPADGKDAASPAAASAPITPAPDKAAPPALPPTVVFSANYLWNRPGTTERLRGRIAATASGHTTSIYCTCESETATPRVTVDIPLPGPYFAADLTSPTGITTGRRRSLEQIRHILDAQQDAFHTSNGADAASRSIAEAIQTTLGWDTNYEPEKDRVLSPVSRVWSVSWGGYVLFDWDTFFAATMASLGSKDLAYANTLEILREETPAGFVPNYARAGNWKSFDRSEPPVGAITALGLYQQFHDRWFLEDAFAPLLRWNRWWAAHRDIQGYLTWGSDGDNLPRNPDDTSVGAWQGAVYESGLDNSPMYDGVAYNQQTHLLEYADVGLMSLYVADCDALAEIATTLGKTAEAAELRQRANHYRDRLKSMWDPAAGIFLNRNLRTNQPSTRLSPTNFYPLLARAATPQQARTMIEKHLTNPQQFWGDYILPSIARDDPAFSDQNYWRGRVWGPMNYLVYLGLRNYDLPAVRADFARKSLDLFLKEWRDHGHVHENYNGITGSGDDVPNSDRFYHWGALLGYIHILDQTPPRQP